MHLSFLSIRLSFPWPLLITVYGTIFSFYLFYLFKLIRKGPTPLVLDGSVAEVITETLFKYLAPEGK